MNDKSVGIQGLAYLLKNGVVVLIMQYLMADDLKILSRCTLGVRGVLPGVASSWPGDLAGVVHVACAWTL